MESERSTTPQGASNRLLSCLTFLAFPFSFSCSPIYSTLILGGDGLAGGAQDLQPLFLTPQRSVRTGHSSMTPPTDELYFLCSYEVIPPRLFNSALSPSRTLVFHMSRIFPTTSNFGFSILSSIVACMEKRRSHVR